MGLNLFLEKSKRDEEEDKEKTTGKPKVSLFGNKRAKTDENSESLIPPEVIEKRRLKSFGKNPEVNTSFLKDEEKDLEETIKKKKLMNQVSIADLNYSLYNRI